MDMKQYIEQLAQASGMTDEEKTGLLKAVSNEKFSKELSADIMRQSDYSRNMDEFSKEKQKWTQWYQEALASTASNAQAVEQANAELARYRALLGGQQLTSSAQQTVQPVNQDFISKKDFEAELGRREQVTLGLLQKGLSIATRHLYEFKEPLDTDALVKFAMEKNQPIDAAYEAMVSPRRLELQQKQWDEKLKQAREDGAKEFASKHKLPVDTRQREYHALLDRPDKPAVEYTPNTGQLSPQATRTIRDNFVESWNSTEGNTSGT